MHYATWTLGDCLTLCEVSQKSIRGISKYLVIPTKRVNKTDLLVYFKVQRLISPEVDHWGTPDVMVLGGSQWGGGFYSYRLKFWLFYGYRLIFFSYG